MRILQKDCGFRADGRRRIAVCKHVFKLNRAMHVRARSFVSIRTVACADRGCIRTAAVAQFASQRFAGALGFMLRLLPILLVLVARLALAEDAPADAPEQHSGAASHRLDATLPTGPLPARDSARDAALQAAEDHLACACYAAGDFQVDLQKGARASGCSCPFAARMRQDLERSLAGLTNAELADKRVVAEHVEAKFVPLQPEYERVFRYPRDRMDWFMKNVRCVCDGCKPTIFFSKCGLSCAPAIVYKLRAKVFLAFGFTTDELLDYYLADMNAQRPPREQITRDYLLPGKQREKGWLVPALAFGVVSLALVWLLRRWARRKPNAPDVVVDPAAPVSDAARRKVEAALDDDPEW